MASWWACTTSRNVVTVSRSAATENRSSGRSSVGTATLYGRPRSEWSNGGLLASLMVLFVPSTDAVLDGTTDQ